MSIFVLKVNRFFLAIAVVLILAIVVAIIFLLREAGVTKPKTNIFFPTPTPFVTPQKNGIKKISSFLDIDFIPMLSSEKGGGVDTSSQPVKDSISEIVKLSPFLPYDKTYTLSTGVEVSVVIPQKDPRDSPWALLVQIFGIDYQLAPEDKDYQLMKNSFREAGGDVALFLEEKGVTLNKVFVVWGDRSFIQNTAMSWIMNP